MENATLLQRVGSLRDGWRRWNWHGCESLGCDWQGKRSLLVLMVAVLAVFTVGCETADPAADATPVVITGVPTGGGPVEDDVAHDVANLEAALERPRLYVGNTLIGQATVYQVVSDRGFWLESGERRIFTVIREHETTPADVDLRRGQVVQLSGELHSADELETFTDQLTEPLTSDAMEVLADQEYFLVVSANTLEVITRGVAGRIDGGTGAK